MTIDVQIICAKCEAITWHNKTPVGHDRVTITIEPCKYCVAHVAAQAIVEYDKELEKGECK